jgi:hypothetical protein
MTETPTLILPLERGRKIEIKDRFSLQYIFMKIVMGMTGKEVGMTKNFYSFY